MLREFLSWWLSQLLDLLPRRLSARAQERGRGVVAIPCDTTSGTALEVDLIDRSARQERSLGRFPLDVGGMRAARRAVAAHLRRRAVLRLPAGMLLERSVALPLAVEREPERVLRYEMDRLTPFRAEEVFWSWQIERRDRQRGRLHLRISLVPKAGLAALLAGLKQLGLAPGTIEVALPAGERRLIAISEPSPRSLRWRRRGLVSAGLLCAVLGVAALAVPFARQSLQSQAIERRIAALKPRVEEVERLRSRLTHDRAGVDALAADQVRLGDALQALAELTQALPDDTYLTELTLQDRKLLLTGQSLAVAKLITALAANPVIRNPAFAASVTRAKESGADLFSIRAELGD